MQRLATVHEEYLVLRFGAKEIFSNRALKPKVYSQVHLLSLRVQGVMKQANYLPDLIETFWLLTFCCTKYRRPP